MRVIALTSIASAEYGVHSEGSEFDLYDPVAVDWIKAGYVQAVRSTPPETTDSPLPEKAEKAVRHERQAGGRRK